MGHRHAFAPQIPPLAPSPGQTLTVFASQEVHGGRSDPAQVVRWRAVGAILQLVTALTECSARDDATPAASNGCRTTPSGRSSGS